jgi:type II secretory pathway component PulF
MPLIVTPALLAQRADLYQQLASLLGAGISILQALESLRKNPPGPSFRQPLTHAIQRLNHGTTFTEAVRFEQPWLPAFDLALLRAGEESGRLPECCRLLAGYYEQRSQLARRVSHSLLYPLFLAHFALLIFPLSHLTALVQSVDVVAFLRAKLVVLLPVYIAVFFLLLAGQAHRSEPWRALVERLLNLIPAVGTARRHLALARLSAALEALLNAGVSILDAWSLAAEVSGSPAIRRAVQRWQQPLEAGATPAELLRATPAFPELFANLYATGEVSGQLDQTLGRLHQLHQEEGSRRLQLLAQWIPLLIYLAIVLSIAWFVLRFWLGYFGGIADVLDF